MNSPTFSHLISRFLRFFFEVLYTDLAWAYDAVAWASSIGQWQTWQQAGIEALQPGTILELGSGTGHVVEKLTSAGRSITAVDVSGQMTRITRIRLSKAGLPVQLAQASSFSLPFPESTFANVLSTFPSEYIFAPESISEILRILKPGGRMIIIPGVAKFTGPRTERYSILHVLDKFSAWLYSFTGEQTSVGPEDRVELEVEMKEMGFSTRIEHVQTERAVVLRIVAVKDEQ